jgi:hypothetical protein
MNAAKPEITGAAGSGDKSRKSNASNNDDGIQLDTTIAELGARLQRVRGLRRLVPLIITGAIVLAVVVAIVMGQESAGEISTPSIAQRISAKLPHLALVLGAALIFIMVLLISRTTAENSLTAEIELLEAKKRIAHGLSTADRTDALEGSHTDSYFERLVKINVENLAEYYTLVKIHTNNSFRASLWAGVIGFSLILIGVIIGFGGASTAAALAAIAGVVVEFISGVFFYLYNKTVQQLKGYHDSLLSFQNVLLSFKLVNDTQDADAKTAMTAKMFEFLLARRNLGSDPREQGEAKPPRSQAGLRRTSKTKGKAMEGAGSAQD